MMDNFKSKSSSELDRQFSNHSNFDSQDYDKKKLDNIFKKKLTITQSNL